MSQKMQRLITILSTTAALITAIVGGLQVVVQMLPSQKEEDEK